VASLQSGALLYCINIDCLSSFISPVLIEELIVHEMVKKCPAFMDTFMRTCHSFLF
jgi:hypothetical protein